MKKIKRSRNNERIELPNGCCCSQLTVHPHNWQSPEADISRNWYIHYRFYPPDDIKGKSCAIRGMNYAKTLSLRRQSTTVSIENELKRLRSGYNPVTKAVIAAPDPDGDYVIHPRTSFSRALQKAFERQEGTVEAKRDLKSSLKYLQLSLHNLGYHERPVQEIKKRHLLNVLENCVNIKKGFNNRQFNHYRGAILQLYKVLIKYDTVEYSPAQAIAEKQHTPAPRNILTPEQRIKIDQHLKIENYRFWNFIHIFYHSGSRLMEIARLQGKHVNLQGQTALYYVKKRGAWAWVERPIPDLVLPFWQRAMKNCGPDQFVFAKNLLPGDIQISSIQYTRRWKTWVKTKLNLDVNIYLLKHTHTTEVVDILDEEAAAKMNGHTTTAMVKKVYDLKNKWRKDDKIKRLPIKFA